MEKSYQRNVCSSAVRIVVFIEDNFTLQNYLFIQLKYLSVGRSIERPYHFIMLSNHLKPIFAEYHEK